MLMYKPFIVFLESEELMDVFEIPPVLRPAIKHSWKQRQSDFIGRFDFIWDGIGNPKLLEYNADTPTILVETGVGQQIWFDNVKAFDDKFWRQLFQNNNAWQFNDINKNLVQAWPLIVSPHKSVSFVDLSLNHDTSEVEDREHVAYLRKTAKEAGVSLESTEVLELRNSLIKYETENSAGDKMQSIESLNVWKGRPYEWLAYEPSSEWLFDENNLSRIRWIEPPWKLIMASKAILPLLWQLHPSHPNLLPATYDRDEKAITDNDLVGKPKYGREGQGITYSTKYSSKNDFFDAAEQASYIRDDSNSEGIFIGDPIYQQYHTANKFSGRHIVIGSWVIHGKPSGICIREDVADTTLDNSSFVPHIVIGKPFQEELPTLNDTQTRIRSQLYGHDKDITHVGHSNVGMFRNWFGGTNQQGAGSGASGTGSSAVNQNKEDIKSKAKSYQAKSATSESPKYYSEKYKKSANARASRSSKIFRSSNVRGFGGRG
jgi:glutathionylspermidine synthase